MDDVVADVGLRTCACTHMSVSTRMNEYLKAMRYWRNENKFNANADSAQRRTNMTQKRGSSLHMATPDEIEIIRQAMRANGASATERWAEPL